MVGWRGVGGRGSESSSTEKDFNSARKTGIGNRPRGRLMWMVKCANRQVPSFLGVSTRLLGNSAWMQAGCRQLLFPHSLLLPFSSPFSRSFSWLSFHTVPQVLGGLRLDLVYLGPQGLARGLAD